jgi:hypothetical protein
MQERDIAARPSRWLGALHTTQFDLQKTFDTLGIAERLKLVEPARSMRFE